jgi:hypothetical protein
MRHACFLRQSSAAACSIFMSGTYSLSFLQNCYHTLLIPVMHACQSYSVMQDYCRGLLLLQLLLLLLLLLLQCNCRHTRQGCTTCHYIKLCTSKESAAVAAFLVCFCS